MKMLRLFVPIFVLCLCLANTAHARPEGCELRHGRLYVNGEWVFLKIGKPLRNFGDAAACDALVADLDTLKEKHYNCLELNCYWHHLDTDGDGVIDVSLEPLTRLVNAIEAQGMFPCLSVETYGVGGGNIAKGFWEAHPDVVAINAAGKAVSDTEYKFGSTVPSIFHPAYLEKSRAYIRNLVEALPHEKFLYFETTVEPQYIGNQNIDYSPAARSAYEAWLDANNIDGPTWPTSFPIPREFLKDPTWNRFRAEALAAWVNGDADTIRAVAGTDAWIAVDYLETGGFEMGNRNGDSRLFLEHLRDIAVVQVNWHWHLGKRSPNTVAYNNLRSLERDWAISEHMTLNASDFRPEEVGDILRGTFAHGTRFGWEFVSVSPSTGDNFALYNDDWTPKPLIAEVDDNWDAWMDAVRPK